MNIDSLEKEENWVYKADVIDSTIKTDLPRKALRGRLSLIRPLFTALLPAVILSSFAFAQSPQFKFVRKTDNGIMTEAVITDSLPWELLAYINKGVPVSFEYRFELWHDNPGWFDKLISESEITLKVRFDTWEKRYSVVQSSRNLTIENDLAGQRETVELLSASGPASFSFDDSSGDYYLYGVLTIKTMSFSNYKEVESWLKGGVSNVKKPQLQEAPDKVGEFVFNMAMKMSGLKNITREFTSGNFKRTDLPLQFSLPSVKSPEK